MIPYRAPNIEPPVQSGQRMSVDDAMDLADCVSPIPALAHKALQALKAEIHRLRAAAAVDEPVELNYLPGHLDRTAPPMVWLQIDTGSDLHDRMAPFPDPGSVSWCGDSVGGTEILYIRADTVAGIAHVPDVACSNADERHAYSIYHQVVMGEPLEDVLADLGASKAATGTLFNLEAHLHRQRTWSLATFGPGRRTRSIIDHLRKELDEVQAAPCDLSEWVDLVLLALDGAWRHGGTPSQIVGAIAGKQSINEARTWPDWRTADPDVAMEHVHG